MENKSAFMKRILMIFLPIAIVGVTTFIILMCFDVIKFPGTEKEKKVTTKTDDIEGVVKVVAPESAAEIYVENMEEWIQGGIYAQSNVEANSVTDNTSDLVVNDTQSSYPVNSFSDSYGYGFLDLDFDGVLELVYSEMSGSGRYSGNQFYKLNTETCKVELVEFAPTEVESEGGYDISTMYPDYPKLLKNKEDDSMFYYCSDFLRVMTGEYLTTYGSLYMKGNEIAEELLFSEYECEAGLEGNEEAIEEYQFYQKGEWNTITKEEYEKKTAEYFEENVNLNLKWKFIDGREFDAADKETKIKMLLESYMAFSYDGFSFDKVETYEIEIKKEEKEEPVKEEVKEEEKKDAKSYTMADYYGMTINDVIAIWGNDYKVLDYIYAGGSGGIYYDYEGKVTFVFYFPWDGGEIPAVFTGNELVNAVGAWPTGQENTHELTKGIGIVKTYAEISTQLSGEYWVNEMEGGNTYSGFLTDKIYFSYTWENDVNVPRDVMVSFQY